MPMTLDAIKDETSHMTRTQKAELALFCLTHLDTDEDDTADAGEIRAALLDELAHRRQLRIEGRTTSRPVEEFLQDMQVKYP